MVNLSMNQTLMRSINTSFVALLPILSILVIGAQFLGAKPLQEFGLALFIGLASGAYSSIFIASPLLAMMKEREGRYATIRQRLSARGEAVTLLTPAAAAAARGGGSQQGALVRAGSGAGRGGRAAQAGVDGAAVTGDGGTPDDGGGSGIDRRCRPRASAHSRQSSKTELDQGPSVGWPLVASPSEEGQAAVEQPGRSASGEQQPGRSASGEQQLREMARAHTLAGGMAPSHRPGDYRRRMELGVALIKVAA